MIEMPARTHEYTVALNWTGNLGRGTADYRAYQRNHEILASGKPTILGSADPAFRGDPSRYNPEELMVAGVSACHMLWYLHLCADGGVVVTDYRDSAVGVMQESPDGSGQFIEVLLRPEVIVTSSDSVERATALHEEAHRFCFIARSVNFPIRCNPNVHTSSPESARSDRSF